MKLLSIGNSFSQDAQRWLHQTAVANGIPFVILRTISDLAEHQANVSFDELEQYAGKLAGDITVASVEMRDAKGRFVPTADTQLEFTAPEGCRILGWGNGDPAFQHIERPVTYGPAASGPSGTPIPDKSAKTVDIVTFNGLAQVILQKM